MKTSAGTVRAICLLLLQACQGRGRETAPRPEPPAAAEAGGLATSRAAPHPGEYGLYRCADPNGCTYQGPHDATPRRVKPEHCGLDLVAAHAMVAPRGTALSALPAKPDSTRVVAYGQFLGCSSVASTANGPRWQNPAYWGPNSRSAMDGAGLPAKWQTQYPPHAPVRVAIIDTQAQLDHPFLHHFARDPANQVLAWTRKDGLVVRATVATTTAKGHGTSVAGIVAADGTALNAVEGQVPGFAPSAELAVYDADDGGKPNVEEIALMADQAIADGVAIVNMSFETGVDACVCDVIDDLTHHGISTVFASAGPQTYPGACTFSAPRTAELVVAANGAPSAQVAALFAPDRVATLTSEGGFGVFAGVSAATAVVVAAVAVALGDPRWPTAAAAVQRVCSRACPRGTGFAPKIRFCRILDEDPAACPCD